MTGSRTLARPKAMRTVSVHRSSATLSLLPMPLRMRLRVHDVVEVLHRWDADHDTAAIAAVTGIPQADVCRIIAADQDRRHTARQAILSRA